MARRCLNTEAQRHRARSCTVPDASRVAGAGKVRLGDVCSFSKGQQINGKELSDSYDYPFINGGVSPSGNWKDYNVEKGAITISEGGNSCGFVNYFEVPFWCGAHCYYFYELKLEPKYFYYALKANEERLMGLRSGICMPNIRKGDLDEFEFCIDWDKATQQRIADELDQLCALKKNAEDRLAILDQIVKSRFVEMFGDVLKKWDKQLLGDIAFITKLAGFEYTKYIKYQDHGDVIMIRGLNCKKTKLVLDDIYWIDRATSDLLPRSKLSKGDLVFTYVGTVGEVAVVDRDNTYHLAPNVAKIELNDKEKFNPYFFAYELMYLREYVLKFAASTTQAALSMDRIRKIPLPIPPLALQREFAAFVAEVDKSELTLRETVATLDQLYRAKLQEYFG